MRTRSVNDHLIFPDYDDKSAEATAPEKQRRNSEGTVNDVMLGNKSVIGRLFNGFGAFDHILEAIFLFLVRSLFIKVMLAN